MICIDDTTVLVEMKILQYFRLYVYLHFNKFLYIPMDTRPCKTMLVNVIHAMFGKTFCVLVTKITIVSIMSASTIHQCQFDKERSKQLQTFLY